VSFKFWFEEIEASLTGKFDRNLDLAVLLVNLKQSTLSSEIFKESLPLTQLLSASDVRTGSTLYPIGHPSGIDWYLPTRPTTVYDIDGERILLDFACDPGFSGGGAFNERWELVGMVRASNPPLCEAIAFDRIQDMLEKWRFRVSLNSGQSKPTAGQERHDSVSGINFVWVLEGCFQMGSPKGETSRGPDEGPLHEICLDGFWMGKYEVTQAQWQGMMGDNPSSFQGESRPVEKVSWNDVQEFLQKLNQQKEIYRLPTEAEWEYAARAGTTTPFSFGNTISTDLANYDGNYSYGSGAKGVYREQTTEVGSFPPNAWGLYDMHGNVWEWCQDWYESEYYATSPKNNPQGSSSGDYRGLRGGSWNDVPDNCRSASRIRFNPGSRGYLVGFRVVVAAFAWTQ
ncbi:MAG: SUMF1/EgtB/PvdO family nonheme iron enzyme, partial [bacterium]|nr:SUMF1/EgtB/PvdO family nonheme iron enzyme [bacterium]